MKETNRRLRRALEFLNKGYLKQAEILYLECLDKVERHSDLHKQALHGLGQVWSEQGQLNEARKIYMELLHAAVDKEDKQGEAIACHQLGVVCTMMNQFDDAFFFFKQEYRIYQTVLPGFHLGFATNLYETGKTYLKQNNIKKARDAMKNSLNHGIQSENDVVIGYTHRYLGYIFKQLQDDKIALDHYLLALKAFQRTGNIPAMKEIEREMANL